MWGLISYPHIISCSFPSIDKISQKRLKGIIKGIIKRYKKDKTPVDNFSKPKRSSSPPPSARASTPLRGVRPSATAYGGTRSKQQGSATHQVPDTTQPFSAPRCPKPSKGHPKPTTAPQSHVLPEPKAKAKDDSKRSTLPKTPFYGDRPVPIFRR